LSKPVLEEQAIEFPVLRAHIHPRYDKPQDGYLANDVAIWELGEPRLFGSSAQIQPIVMADTALPSDYHMATVIGWGETRRRDYSDHLKQVNLPVWQWNDCVKEHGSGDIHRGMLCAGGRSHKDACHGDSGGPLIVRSADGRPILIGLVSWGLLCGVKGLPGVYTNVSYYLPWIQSIVG
jgi:secreted trypsin-like serine protease